MHANHEKVLKALRRYSSISDSQLALVTDLPAPSCRRIVQTLRREGYTITDMEGLRSGRGYTLTEPAAVTPAGDQNNDHEDDGA